MHVRLKYDEHIDEDFPGYPHYPAKEDILDPKNHTDRVNANVENLDKENLNKEDSDKKGKPILFEIFFTICQIISC